MGSAIEGFQGPSFTGTHESFGKAGKEQAKRLGGATRERVLSEADHRKGALVEQLRGVVSSLESLSKETDSAIPQRLLRGATDILRQACETVEGRSTSDLLQEAQGSIRQRPGAWIAGCLAAGFLAGRLLKA